MTHASGTAMTDDPTRRAQGSVQIHTGDELSRGRYSNNMLVAHTREEFILDWLLTTPSGNHLVSRVVVSPGHMKRIVAALQDNLRKYETGFGEITPVEPGGPFH